MWFLWIFGDNIEHRFGPLFLPFYLLGGVAAGLAQYFLNTGSAIPMLGASGAVAAVLGAYLVLYAHHKVNTFVALGPVFSTIQVSAPVMLGYWFLIQVISGVTTLGVSAGQDIGGVAYFAHIGGFVFGWLLAQPFKRPPPADPELARA
jgi:membrane associated rhomboid family serine protease